MPISTAATLSPNAPISSLPEFILGRLRLQILNGFLKPGDFLRQEELAKRFGVSRVPLREALNRLEAEGLIVLLPRRGYAVTSLDPVEITEIFELRMVIEEHAGAVAAANREPDDIRDVAILLKEMERLDRDAETYFLEWARLNREFHARLIASGRRKRLARIAGVLRDAVEPYIRVEARMTGHVDDAEAEHRAMFNAFKAGDARRLGKLSAKHCENTARRLLGALRAKATRVRSDSRIR